MSQATALPNVRTLALWRTILRWTKLMPKAQSDYYQAYSREHLVAHMDEDEDERIDFLLQKGFEHVKFIVAKYDLENMVMNAALSVRSDKSIGSDLDSLPRTKGAPSISSKDQASMSERKPEQWVAGGQEMSKVGESAATLDGAVPTLECSRSLKGIIVEKDVLGQLILKELSKAAKAQSGGKIKVGDVLTEINGVSVRGTPPIELSVGKGMNTFKFGRRKAGGGVEWSEISLDDA